MLRWGRERGHTYAVENGLAAGELVPVYPGRLRVELRVECLEERVGGVVGHKKGVEVAAR